MFLAIATFWWLTGVYLLGLFLIQGYGLIDRYKWNPFRKPELLSNEEKALLLKCFPACRKMSPTQKLRFEKRTLWFRRVKNFKFMGDVQRRQDLIVVVSATLALLTMGLSNFRYMRSLKEIAIYPSHYFSRFTRQHHFGEYNPKFKRAIISAEQFWKGFEIADDNRNLAIHELAHALSFDLLKQPFWEGIRFRWGLRKIKKLHRNPSFALKLSNSAYFREYGMTNLQEFFAVVVENYVETPRVFKKEFPKLYEIIRTMLGFEYTKHSF